MSEEMPQLIPPEDIDQLVRMPEELRVTIVACMHWLTKAAKGARPDWWLWSLTPQWRQLRNHGTQEALTQFELMWRMIYKRPAYRKLLEEGIQPTSNDRLIAEAAHYMIWMELKRDDRRFAPFEPDPAKVSDNPDEVQATMEKVRNHPWMSTRPTDMTGDFVVLEDPDRKIVHTRSKHDIEVIDWIEHILVGNLEGWQIRYRDSKELLQAPQQNPRTPGVLLFSRDHQTIYQVGKNGQHINVTKKKKKGEKGNGQFNDKFDQELFEESQRNKPKGC